MKYLSIDYGTGNLYQTSKEAREGFTEFTSTKGNVSFRNTIEGGIIGKYVGLELRDSPFGQRIAFNVNVDGDIHQVQLGLYDQSGNVDSGYTESLIRFLPNLVVGQSYKVLPWVLSAEYLEESDRKADKPIRKRYYPKRGVSFREIDPLTVEVGDKVPPSLNYVGDNAIPRLEWKEKMGKNRPTASSLEAKDDFLLAALQSAIDLSDKSPHKEEVGKRTPTKPNTQSHPGAKVTPNTSNNFEDDDLPF